MKNFDEINDNINELLLNKKFSELTPEEKEKALAYAGSESEYDLMRNTLMAITGSFGEEEEEMADLSTKNDLMQRFAEKHGGAGNAIKTVPFYRQPYFQLAVAASVALLIFFALPVFKNDKNEMALADNTEVKSKNETVPTDKSVAESVALDSSPAKNTAEEIASGSSTTTNTLAVVPNELSLEEAEKAEAPPVTANVYKEDRSVPSAITEGDLDDNVSTKKDVVKSSDEVLAKSTNTRERNESVNRKEESKSKAAKKSNNENLNDLASGVVNSAPGAAIENQSTTNLVNAYVSKNKNEIMDLLFTNF